MTLDTKTPKRISEAVGCTLLLSMLFLLGASLIPWAEEITVGQLFLRMLVKLSIFLFPMAWLVRFVRKRKIGLPMPAEKAALNKTLMLTLSSAGLIVIVEMLYAAVFPSATASAGVAKGNTFFENILLFLLTAGVPAVSEELLFRGAILRSLRVFRTSLAILMSALVFALMHFSMEAFPIAFVSGLIFGMAYVSTGSVRSVIGIHFLCNAFWFLAETVSVYIPDGYAVFMRGSFAACVLLSSAGLPFLRENTAAFFADDEYAVPSSAVWTMPMMLFLVLSVGIQLLA